MSEQNLTDFINNLPNRKDETWKYTNLGFFFEDQINSEKSGSLTFTEEEKFFVLELKNNSFTSIENDFIRTTVKASSPLEIKSGNISKDKAFTMLNNSNIDLLSIEIKKDLDRPLWIKHSYTGENKLIDTKIEISSLAQELDILESFESLDNSKVLVSNLTSVQTNKNKIIRHTSFQKLNDSSMLLNNTVARSLKDSTYKNINIHTGSRLTRHNVHSELLEENATSEVHGLYIGKDKTHIDTNSFIHHLAAHTFSFQLYKTVLDDKSRGVFTGLIRVEQDAQKIESNQLNKNLLLTNTAHANSRPQLEIYADDVKCAHGSTTGQMNNDELFYFQARGIDPVKARGILAKAFINEVIFKVDNTNIKKLLLKEM